MRLRQRAAGAGNGQRLRCAAVMEFDHDMLGAAAGITGPHIGAADAVLLQRLDDEIEMLALIFGRVFAHDAASSGLRCHGRFDLAELSGNADTERRMFSQQARELAPAGKRFFVYWNDLRGPPLLAAGNSFRQARP